MRQSDVNTSPGVIVCCPRCSGWSGGCRVPLVITAELPSPDIAIVFPPGEGQVMMFVDPRVPYQVVAETIDRVSEALHSCDGGCIARLAELE